MSGNNGFISALVNNDQSSDTTTTNNTTDNSKAFGGPTVSGQQQGSNFTVDGAGATITTVDPGAIAAGQAIATQAIQGNQAATLAFAGDVQYALGRTLDLATASQQGQGGTLIKGLIWIVGLSAGGVVLFAIFGRKKKETRDAR